MKIIFLILCQVIAFSTDAQIYPLAERVPRENMGLMQQPNEKMDWLLDDKYGLFIHWGLYSGPANGEWYMSWAGIPIDEYRKFAFPESGDKQFVADKFNADEWANLAKEGGMKYMNLTAMHRDGITFFSKN